MKIKLCIFARNYFSEKNDYVPFTSLLRRVSNSKLLIMSDGHSYFNHSIPFLYGDSVGGYVERFFYPLGKYFKENP